MPKGVYERSPDVKARLSAWGGARQVPQGSESWAWVGDEAGYSTVHLRLKTERGRAADQFCVDCPRPAAHWSLSWREIDPARVKMGTGRASGFPYTTRLSDYAPRCRTHATLYDLEYPQ